MTTAITHGLLTHDGARAKLAIEEIVSGGDTYAAAAITLARTELTGARRTPGSTMVLILLSDGQDGNPLPPFRPLPPSPSGSSCMRQAEEEE